MQFDHFDCLTQDWQRTQKQTNHFVLSFFFLTTLFHAATHKRRKETSVAFKYKTHSATMTSRLMLSDQWTTGVGKASDPWLFDTAGLLPLALHSSLASPPLKSRRERLPLSVKLPLPLPLNFSNLNYSAENITTNTYYANSVFFFKNCELQPNPLHLYLIDLHSDKSLFQLHLYFEAVLIPLCKQFLPDAKHECSFWVSNKGNEGSH